MLRREIPIWRAAIGVLKVYREFREERRKRNGRVALEIYESELGGGKLSFGLAGRRERGRGREGDVVAVLGRDLGGGVEVSEDFEELAALLLDHQSIDN